MSNDHILVLLMTMEHTRYLRKMVVIFSSDPFFSRYVHLPSPYETSPHPFQQNRKLWPFFKDALGAIDGSHIPCAPRSATRGLYRNRKGFVSQNTLFVCSFSFRFLYCLCGWEGSATDARIWEDALGKGLVVPDGKYYLADAGYPSCSALLLPYRSVRYHLAEWGRARVR